MLNFGLAYYNCIGHFSVGEKNGICYFQEEIGKIYREVWDYGNLVKRALVKTDVGDIEKMDLDAQGKEDLKLGW